MADDNVQNQEASTSGFEGYKETSVDPGIWLLVGTTSFCAVVMLIILPLLVLCKRRQTRHTSSSECSSNRVNLMLEDFHKMSSAKTLNDRSNNATKSSSAGILRCDEETCKILGLAGPFTVSAMASSVCSNACLIMVSRYIGTKAAAAYAIVQILLGLSDGVLYGPISACTTLCSHAVGAGNSTLAGEYIQLALTIYLLCNVPVLIGWWYYMYEVVLYLEWGDVEIAQLAQDFVRPYLFSNLFSAISSSIWQLLEITDHAVIGTICSIVWGFANVAILRTMIAFPPGGEVTLSEVAWMYNGTSIFFVCFTYTLADCLGWLKPFKGGLFNTCALRNLKAVNLLFTQAVPLSLGYLLSNAEWAVLTIMASHLGPAEVAAWAILGSIWEVFYTTTAGIGDAAEIRVSHHLGENAPNRAKKSAYKSLFLGMVVASMTSLVYFLLQDQLPLWFTTDETLQAMLQELVPFVGVANLTMTFGMQCWSIIGAQGCYSLATWVNSISSWGVCMPIAATFTYVFRFDLQGLASAVTVGYVVTGSVLSYILLSTDWYKVARRIHQNNNDVTPNESDGVFFAVAPHKKGGNNGAARRNVTLLTIPSGYRSRISIGMLDNPSRKFISKIHFGSPLMGVAQVGNLIMAVNGGDVSHMSVDELLDILNKIDGDRFIAVTAQHVDRNVDDTNSQC
jgi:Na+-driven multidrug efflux pump